MHATCTYYIYVSYCSACVYNLHILLYFCSDYFSDYLYSFVMFLTFTSLKRTNSKIIHYYFLANYIIGIRLELAKQKKSIGLCFTMKIGFMINDVMFGLHAICSFWNIMFASFWMYNQNNLFCILNINALAFSDQLRKSD